MNGNPLQIETLRQQLHETAARYSGNLLHPHVLRISQELDLLIFQFQKSERQTKETGTESS